MSGRISEETHWAAFRYVSAELSEQERVRFEQQLADDPPACQAVAEAVELAVAMAAAPGRVQRPAPADSARSVGRGVRWWTVSLSLAGGLLLALAAGWAALRGGVISTPQIPSGDALIGPELAIIWSQTTPPSVTEVAWDDEQPESPSCPTPSDPWEPVDAGIPPDWVLSAVVAAAQAESDDDLSEPEGL